jgi:hydrogenase maturation protease
MNRPDPRGKTLIVGLGNLLLRDDGVGVHAARVLAQDPPPGVDVLDVGTACLHGLACVESAARVLALDAMYGGGSPGSLYLMDGTRETTARLPDSLHAMGFLDSLRLLERERRPRDLILLGIEPQTIG